MACFLLPGCGVFKNDVLSKYDIKDIEYISYIDTVCDDEIVAKSGKELLRTMEKNDDLLMSFVVDSSIEMTSDELGDYDHLIMTNPQWIKRFGDMSKLKSIEFEDLSDEMQEFLNLQMPVLTIDGSTLPKGIELYEYTTDDLLAFPVNVTLGAADPLEASNPFVLVNEPTVTLKASGCLFPSSSSGNLLFTKEDLLVQELEKSRLVQYGQNERLSELK